jgi:hypothetical protein
MVPLFLGKLFKKAGRSVRRVGHRVTKVLKGFSRNLAKVAGRSVAQGSD